jgi:hypothetical protein
MNKNEERHLLKQILKTLDGDILRSKAFKWLPWVGWIVLVSHFLLLLKFQLWLGPYWLILLSFLAGAGYAAADIWTRNRPKWKYIVPHLDRASVERRVREIGPI